MTDTVKIGLPSKGRMKSDSDLFLKSLGFKVIITNGERGYHDSVEGWPNIEIKRLPASLIADEILSGELHYGLTGLDLVAERDPAYELAAKPIQRLDFGHADLVVAVPKFWLDVDFAYDLPRLGRSIRDRFGRRVKIATKYTNLTAEYLEGVGLVDFELIYSDGATEAAPANHLADFIVDITSSGATLEANNLKILQDGVILKSQAIFWQAQNAIWHDNAKAFHARLNERKS